MNLLLKGQMTVLAAAMRIMSVGLLKLDFTQPALQSPYKHLIALVRRLYAAVGVSQMLQFARLCFDNPVLFSKRIMENIDLRSILHDLSFFLPQQLSDLSVTSCENITNERQLAGPHLKQLVLVVVTLAFQSCG